MIDSKNIVILDEKDILLMNSLRQNSRRKIVDLARDIGLSRTATHDRLMRLDETQAIKKYTIVVNDNVSGIIRAFLFVQFKSGANNSAVAKQILALADIDSTFCLSGTIDLIAQAFVGKSSDLLKLREIIANIDDIATVSTHPILKENNC